MNEKTDTIYPPRLPGISWRVVLKYLCEFPEGDWVTVQDFGKFYNMSNTKIQKHFAHYLAWSYARRRILDVSQKPGRVARLVYEYQATDIGRKKVDYFLEKIAMEAKLLTGDARNGSA